MDYSLLSLIKTNRNRKLACETPHRSQLRRKQILNIYHFSIESIGSFGSFGSRYLPELDTQKFTDVEFKLLCQITLR